MRLVIAPRARRELGNHLGFLADQDAVSAAQTLEARIEAFLQHRLAPFPRMGTHLGHRDLWEIWIPDTRIVLWYRFSTDELQVVRVCTLRRIAMALEAKAK